MLARASADQVALVYFVALRPGEARGVTWSDYDGKRLHVRRSIWRTHGTAPKTPESLASVPVCETLAEILNSQRKDSGYILTGVAGKAVNLNNLAKRVVIPALRKAAIDWRGWYAFAATSRRMRRPSILRWSQRVSYVTAISPQLSSITSRTFRKRLFAH
jgi:integrase